MNPLLTLASLWKTLTGAQKVAALVAVVILGAMTIIVVKIASAPKFVVLYPNLTQEDSSAVVQKLKDMKVAYRLEGSAVEVPENKADELRMTMAVAGIPMGGYVGFEIFDKQQFGQSEFGERLNLTRAVQGELNRTLEKLAQVIEARVQLAVPEHRLYSAEEKPASASVMLKLRGPLSEKEIKGVIYLISSAVEGLKPENVTVVDTEANLLSDQINGDGSGTRLQSELAAEKIIEAKLQDKLDTVLGPGKSLVIADVKIGFDRASRDTEKYSADSGSDTNRSTNNQPVGETVSPNIPPPAVPAVPDSMTPAGSTSTTSAPVKDIVNASKVVEHTDISPGQIQDTTIALFLDQSIVPDQASLLRGTVAAGAGITPDKVTVQSIAFDTTAAKNAEDEAKNSAKSSLWGNIGKTALSAGLILVFIVVLFSIYRRTTAQISSYALPEGQYPALTPPGRVAEQYSATNNALMNGEMSGQDIPINQLDPKRIAQVIQGLLAEDSEVK